MYKRQHAVHKRKQRTQITFLCFNYSDQDLAGKPDGFEILNEYQSHQVSFGIHNLLVSCLACFRQLNQYNNTEWQSIITNVCSKKKVTKLSSNTLLRLERYYIVISKAAWREPKRKQNAGNSRVLDLEPSLNTHLLQQETCSTFTSFKIHYLTFQCQCYNVFKKISIFFDPKNIKKNALKSFS